MTLSSNDELLRTLSSSAKTIDDQISLKVLISRDVYADPLDFATTQITREPILVQREKLSDLQN